MTTMAEPEIEWMAAEISRSLVGKQFGSSTRITGASYALRADADDEQAVYFEVKLAKPTEDLETWPPDELRDLRAYYRVRLAEHSLPLVTYLRVVSERQEETISEDEAAPVQGA